MGRGSAPNPVTDVESVFGKGSAPNPVEDGEMSRRRGSAPNPVEEMVDGFLSSGVRGGNPVTLAVKWR